MMYIVNFLSEIKYVIDSTIQHSSGTVHCTTL